jgi:topoisomerase-4 subunit A
MGHLVIITKKGMAIRFPGVSVNPMGKAASGVTGMSIKDDDEVIYGKAFTVMGEGTNGAIEITNLDEYKLQLTSKNKESKELLISEIKLQNRAGRGSSVMMVLLEDEIKNIN